MSGLMLDTAWEKYILIYNTYEDKEYKKTLEILKPIIQHVEIIEIIDKRVDTNVVTRLSVKLSIDSGI